MTYIKLYGPESPLNLAPPCAMIAAERISRIIFHFIFFFLLPPFLPFSFLPFFFSLFPCFSPSSYFSFSIKIITLECQCVNTSFCEIVVLSGQRRFSEHLLDAGHTLWAPTLDETCSCQITAQVLNVTQRLCTMNLKCQFYESLCSTPHEFLNCPFLGLPKEKKKKHLSILVLNIRG